MKLPSIRLKVALPGAAIALVFYGALAYLLLPLAWRHYEHQRALSSVAMLTHTHDGVPGDPINVGLVGSQDDVLCALHAAGWFPADPLTWRSSLAIVGSVLLNRPYRDAPVSHLYYQDRHQDLAFEKPVGRSAHRRHHVRFWKALDRGQEGRAVWLGAATYDRGVGFSTTTARSPTISRPTSTMTANMLIADLRNAKVTEIIYEITGVGPSFLGRNGEGDLYRTDGEVKISVLAAGCATRVASTNELDNPPIVTIKNLAWDFINKLLPASMPAAPQDDDGP